MADNIYKVRLVSTMNTNEKVVFDVTPEISETQTVNYTSAEPIHMPGAILFYRNSSTKTVQINSIKLITRTQDEALKNVYKLNLLRSWLKPVFGTNSSTLNKNSSLGQTPKTTSPNTPNKEWLGAPPPVLLLSAYANETAGHIRKIPVVITSISIPYPSDVDYIPTLSGKDVYPNTVYEYIPAGIPMPTIMTIDIQCMETHSPKEFSNFDLGKYRRGELDNF